MLLSYNASIDIINSRVSLAKLVQMHQSNALRLYCWRTDIESPSNDLMLFTPGTVRSLCSHVQDGCHRRCYMLASRWLILWKTPSFRPASIESMSFIRHQCTPWTPPHVYPCLLYHSSLSEFFDQCWNLIGQRHNTASAMKRSKYNMSTFNGFSCVHEV